MDDLMLREVRPVPLAPGGSEPDSSAAPMDVLVREGRVAAVGAGLERPAGVVEVDGGGRWLLPGLWDQHVHLGQWTLAAARLDTSRTRSPEDAVALAAEAVAESPGRPVIGWGHRPAVWYREPTVAELDEATGWTPVVLIAGDGHHGWLNSAALTALSLPERDEVVFENEWFAAYDRLTTLVVGDGSSPAAYRRTVERAVAQGVVGVVDLEFTGTLDTWRHRWAEGVDLLRVRVGHYAEELDDVLAAGLSAGDPLLPDEPRGDLLTAGPLKIISDGSLNTRTAWCCEPYAYDYPHPAGLPNLDDGELHALLARAHRAGLQVATHAIGDAAVDAALTAYERTGARGSIEHAQLVRHEDVRRLAALGLRASVQPAHLLDDRDVSALIWGDRADRCFAFRWMLDAGVDLRLGSDAPVSPLDPWLAIDAAVRRTDDDRPAWNENQTLTMREALVASVDGVLAVEPGGPGDLVLLDHDPLDTPPAPGAEVALTAVAGQVVHQNF